MTQTRNINITRDQAGDYEPGAYTPGRYPPATSRRPINWRAVLIGVAVAGLALLCAGAALWRFVSYRYQYDATFAAFANLSLYIVGAALLAALLAVCYAGAAGAVRYARRAGLVEWVGGYVVSARAIGALDLDQLSKRHTAIEIAYANNSILQRATNVSNINVPQLAAGPTTIEAEIVEDTPALIPDGEWIPWLTELPHTMIAGATNSGKTTLARIEVFERLSHGYAGIVLDPKGKEWYGLPVFGGGREFGAILTTLDGIHDEMEQRFKAYAEGERAFQPIKVLVDEVPDIMDACLDMRRKLVDGRWSRFARQLGSLAREVGVSVTLITQSPLVEDIGMNSAMRKNFSRVALGDEAPILIREERDPRRRAALQNLLRGQQYPAAMMRRGQVHLLDTTNVVSLAARMPRQVVGWGATAPQIGVQPARAVVSAYQSAKVERASAAGAIVYPPHVTTPNGRIAWMLDQGYTYRQIERELSVSHATISKVSVALQKIRMGANQSKNGA